MRRHLKTSCALLAMLALAAVLGLTPALAQPYPSRSVRIIVPFAPGGTVDVFGRIIADRLTARLNQTFYVENVAGASGNIATAQAVKATADGHTVYLAFSTYVINPSLFTSVPYDAVKDLRPVTLAASTTHVITVTPTVEAKTLAELVALIRANPGKYNFAHGGAGTPAHLLGEQFRTSLKLDIVAVPFNGAGPAITSIIGGHTPIGFTTITSAATQITGGQIRALAVTSRARASQLPDVPTTTEAGFPDITGDIWIGLMVPAQTPQAVVDTLHAATTAALAEPETRERLAKAGLDAVGSTPEAFASQIARELVDWRRIISAANLKPH